MARTQKHNYKIKDKGILALFICILVLLVSFTGFTVKYLTYDKVYEGVFINNTDVSGLTREELIAQIPEIFDMSLSKNVTLKAADSEISFESLEVLPALDTEKMADEAFSYGRTKKFLARFSEIRSLKKNPVSVDFSLLFDEAALQKKIDLLSKNLEITAIDNKIEYGNNSLIITRGKAGQGIIYNEVKEGLSECLLGDSSSINVNLKHVEPEEITYEYIRRYTGDVPVEASYKIENHRIIFTESQPGVSIKKGDIEDAIKNSASDTINIPAKITQPDITSEKLRETLLAHELGRYSTDYSSSSADRAYNIKLACEKINGYVLAPGDEFSYNNVVGPRTVERGFRIANVYVGNTVQPGIGGGICQVSSTMYNAVVFADLEITERRNHTLPVAYVPKGRDATVSYGGTDFCFKNNTSMPVEIRAIAEGGINTIVIVGTDEHPEREIKITTQQTGSSSPKVIIKKDATLPEGEVKVESEGTTGSSHIAYKIVYENGEEVSRSVLSKSTYAGKDRVEIHGTMKVEPEPSETPSETPPPQESPTPTETPSPTEEIPQE